MKCIYALFIFIPVLVFGSMARYDHKWSKNKLSTCFASSTTYERLNFFNRGVSQSDIVEYNQEEKQAIREVLTENFTLKEVGISFTGFKNCSEDSRADIYIVKFASPLPQLPAGWASMTGDAHYENCYNDVCSITYLRDVQQPYVAMNVIPVVGRKTTDLQRLRILALHEFGHIAGLMHEHTRPERGMDRNCIARESTLGDDIHLPNPTNVFGPYDSNSTMNYCYIGTINWTTGLDILTKPEEEIPIHLTDTSIFSQWREGDFLRTIINIKLSQGDRETLRCLYVYKGDEFKRQCKATETTLI